MKIVSYAAQQLVTTDDVADALVVLAAAIANEGGSQAVRIPIVIDGTLDSAELVVGLGNDVLVAPQASAGDEPDFSEHAQKLREHPSYPLTSHAEEEEETPFEGWNLDLDLDAGTRTDRG
ncbi:hypothetical protein [Microbacterium sp. NPDC090003]|jgi:hypothetical protein|uniref:hypothetical protein n=1 Tax=Microbacterium sp. NPDC090003 TaxID=3364203 RepID=UPI00380632BB